MKRKSSDKYTDQDGPKPKRRYDIERTFFCMCGHHSIEHIRKTEACKVELCDCDKADSVNEDYLHERQQAISDIGFHTHINEIATCLACGDAVSIGRWYDPLTVGRALVHARQLCKRRGSNPPGGLAKQPATESEIACRKSRFRLVCR